MAAAELSPESTPELTNAQKYQRLREKMLVEVKIISAGSAQWIEARIKQANKGGAFCRLSSTGLERFWHWTEIRPSPKSDNGRPIATLGEIAAHAIPAPRVANPPPPALAAALTLRQAPPPPVLISREALRLAAPEPPKPPASPVPPPPPPPPAARVSDFAPANSPAMYRQLPIRQSHSPLSTNTESGLMIKGERMRRQLRQVDLAERVTKALGTGAVAYNSRISKIEFGKNLATDDELIALAQVLELPLDRLIEARDRDRRTLIAKERTTREEEAHEEKKRKDRERKRALRAERAELTGRQVVSRPLARVDQPTDPFRARVPSSAPAMLAGNPFRAAQPATLTDLAALVEALVEIVPMPLDADLRKRWFQCASELFRIAGGG